jgi:SAM-dependent methyltransferase
MGTVETMRHPWLITNRCTYIASLVAGKDVLDIGCVEHSLDKRRHGHWLHDYIRKSAAHVVGLDYEQAEVDKLNAEGYDVIAADATNFDIGRQFDVVVAGELIEHLLNAKGFLESVRKHLRPGGFLVLTTPNANCLLYFLENLVFGGEHDSGDHTCIYSPTTMQVLMRKCGYDVGQVVFIAENTAYFHKSLLAKLLVQVKQFAQLTIGLIRPSICHHFLVIAHPSRA